MEKDKLAWVVVRALGVYFTAQAFIHLYSLSALFLALSNLHEIATLREDAEIEIVRTWVDVGIIGIQFFLFVFLSYYCLRKGRLVHKLLMYPGSNEQI